MLTIIKPGIFTTVQDTGRFHAAHLGIPVGGPMDARSAEMANALIGNTSEDAVLECTYTGPVLQFHKPTSIAVAGAEVEVFINGILQPSNGALKISKEDIVTFGKFHNGSRIYVAVRGGIQSSKIYQSRSTSYTAGILKPLQKGESIPYNEDMTMPSASVTLKRSIGKSALTAFEGPEFHHLNKDQRKLLQSFTCSIESSSNRMAYQVRHTMNLINKIAIISSGTIPGTVQLTPNGQLIILMRDCQTTGGYPRVLQLSEPSICELSQKSPNEEIEVKLSSYN